MVRIHGREIVGFSVAVDELDPDGAVRLQEEGLGGRRRFGCGLFLPGNQRLARDRVPHGSAELNVGMRRLELRLTAPGMTPFFRAGLGGLAASLRYIRHRVPHVAWPSGSWTVDSDCVVLEWTGLDGAGPFFERLFELSFRLTPDLGMIHLPGAFGSDVEPLRLSALQDAIRTTLLQHGKTVRRAGPGTERHFPHRNGKLITNVQRYAGYVHQGAWSHIARELDRPPGRAKPIRLAGWGNPGAVHRHIAYPHTKPSYSVEEALCACFALVGTISYQQPFGGVLVVPVPSDLKAFARHRPYLTPRRLTDIFVSGPADAVLSLLCRGSNRATRAEQSGVSRVVGLSFKSTPWARQQKSRVEVVDVEEVSSTTLARYRQLIRSLPSRVVRRPQSSTPDADTYFLVCSALRGFVAGNFARNRAWYEDFGSARDPSSHDRYLHTHRHRDNYGALWPRERTGLRKMIDYLADSESLLVRSIHAAMRTRLDTITVETPNPAVRKLRLEREQDRWRTALSGARTHEQVRHALADLWSRAGHVSELQERWVEVLPLLREDRWRAARDLALVALASYPESGPNGTTEVRDSPADLTEERASV